MNIDRNKLFAAAGIAGIILGALLAGAVQQNDTTYCQQIEQDIRENRSFNGSIGCYPPGVLDANVSDRVEENADLKCVCRIIDRTGIRLFPVAVSN